MTATDPTESTPAGAGGAESGTPTAPAERTPTEDWDDRVLNTPTSAEGPGFGSGVAVLALFGALLVVRRRR